MTSAADLIRSNDLPAARAMLVEAVKRTPADASARYALAEVLILQGDYERADTHLDMASTQDPTLGTLVALLRQLVRAAVHREEVFTAGRSPDLVTESTPVIETALRILLESRTGEGAGLLREAADEAAPELAGTCDGTAFDDPTRPRRPHRRRAGAAHAYRQVCLGAVERRSSRSSSAPWSGRASGSGALRSWSFVTARAGWSTCP